MIIYYNSWLIIYLKFDRLFIIIDEYILKYLDMSVKFVNY